MAKTRLYEEILKTSENVLNDVFYMNTAFIELFKQSLRVGDNSFLKTFKTDNSIINLLSETDTENIFKKRVLSSFSLFSVTVYSESIRGRKPLENRNNVNEKVLNIFNDYLLIIYRISKINPRLCSMFFCIPFGFCKLISEQNFSEFRETTSKIRISFTPNCTVNDLKMLFSEENSAENYTKQVLFLGEFYSKFSEDLFISPSRFSEQMACFALQIDPLFHPYDGLDDLFLTDEEFGLLRSLNCSLYNIAIATRRRLQNVPEDESADNKAIPLHDCPPMMAESLVFSELYIACLGSRDTWSSTAFALAWFLYYRLVLENSVSFDRSVYRRKTMDSANKALYFSLTVHGYIHSHPIQRFNPEDKADISNKAAENAAEDYIKIDKQPYFALSYCPECGKPLIITEYSRSVRACPFCGKPSVFSSPETIEAE